MIIRSTPTNVEGFILVTNSDTAFKLQEMEFYPMYIDNDGLYFAKSDELIKVLNKISTVER